jgi:hypothetical protein
MQQMRKRPFIQSLSVLLLLVGVLVLGIAPAIGSISGDCPTRDTPDVTENHLENDVGDTGQTEGDPDEDSVTIQDVAVQILTFLSKLGALAR